jgi:uncharacterized protein (DUF849 family)
MTGSAHTPAMSPYLPYTADQVVEDSINTVKAGAAVIHLHARDPRDGRPTPDPEIFMEYASRIKQGCDGIISISTGGGTGMTVDERLQGVRLLKPELCTLNMGTMNYGNFQMIPKYRGKWQFDWEEPYLESTRSEPFFSTFKDIETMLTAVSEETGARFEMEAYDVGHLYTMAYYLDRGLVKPPIFLQTIFGAMGGIGPDVDNLVFMKRTADRLLGDAFVWSVLAAGRYQLGLVTVGAIMGSSVRVGMEDNLYIGKGALAKSNAEMVAKIRRILEELSLEIATPEEAREVLQLKGLGQVAF